MALKWGNMLPDEKLDEMSEELGNTYKRIKQLEDWKDETDDRIKRIIAWVNDALRQKA